MRSRSLLSRPAGLAPVLLSLLLAIACGRSAAKVHDQPLRFGAIPDETTTDLAERFAPVSAYLSKELGIPVEYVPMESYAALVEAFKSGDVQLAWFGGLTWARACAAVPGTRAIAMGKVDPDFKSYFIANASTGIERSDSFPLELRGKTFTFGSDSSTSGRLMPEYYIRKETGQSPEEFFGRPNAYSGSHDKTALLVQEGAYEAGALNYTVYDKMVKDGRIDPKVCRVIWETPGYADYNWTANPLLDERYGAGFIDRLQKALVGLKDPAILTSMMRPDGLIAASNEDFAAVQELATKLGLVR